MEFFFEKNFGEVLDQYQLPIRRNFEYLEKKRRFQIFQKPSSPGFQSFLVKHSKLYIQFIYEADLSKLSSISVLSHYGLDVPSVGDYKSNQDHSKMPKAGF